VKTNVRKLRELVRKTLKEVQLDIEKEEVDGWIVERMPGYVSVDNGGDVFIELDDRGMHLFIGSKRVFIPARVAGALERDMLE
jgi:sporulation protein YlmC with PRC-barrel domain